MSQSFCSSFHRFDPLTCPDSEFLNPSHLVESLLDWIATYWKGPAYTEQYDTENPRHASSGIRTRYF